MRATILLSLVAMLLAGAAETRAAEAGLVPVVIAIDASRSLRPAELSNARTELAAILEQLPGSTPSGLLAFADDTRWIRPLGTPLGEIPQALAEIVPYGQHTLLHDALFSAAVALEPSGGVILLLTDGLDENSATTVEDVTRRCEAAGVSVLTIGLGRQQERSLRRIALLTRGAYLGPLPTVEPAAVVAQVEAAAATRTALRAEREAASQPAPAPSPVVVPAPAVATPEPAASPGGALSISSWPLLLLGFALLLAAISVFALLARRRPREGGDPRAIALENELRAAEERELQLALRDRAVASPDETAEIAIPRDLRDDLDTGEDDPFEKTRVLAQRSLVMVKEPGAAIRSLVLRGERGFGVGREAHNNTLRIADPAMSGHHFKIVPEGESFVLVDLGSTNGTYVNRERVRARRLASGDVIHAGQVEFEFRTFDQPLN